MSDIVTRLRGIDGFGWQCGQPLKDDARRLICNIVSTACSEWSEDVAKEYGWEYLFKEDGK
jgi:hypothetical protein